MEAYDDDSNLKWKVNVIAGGSPENKTALPRNKAQKRLLKILDNVQESIFNDFIQFKKKQIKRNIKNKIEGAVDKVRQAKQNAINQAKAKVEELQQKVDAIKERLSDKVEEKVEQVKDTVEQLVNKIKQKILQIDDCIDRVELIINPLNKARNFENWGGTVDTQYSKILYPTDFPPGEQVSQIQQFVRRNSVFLGKRTRGSGIRHSWGNVFSDPDNFLVSFYPYEVATGSSWQLQEYAGQMLELEKQLGPQGIEHLGMIRKVGQYNANNSQGKQVTKHLVKIGAGVSNDQLRRWCIQNNYQYKSNVIMIEVNVCGGIGTCSHGAGIDTQTLSDYLYEVQFIDYKGNLQTINKKDNPTLILSTASSLGLLGLMVYVTLELEALEVVQFLPRQTYKDFVIPTPKNYTKNEQRKQRPEYKQWLEDNPGEQNQQNWDQNFRKFKEAIHKSYCQWFYFPYQEVDVFENCWDTFAVKTPQIQDQIKEANVKGKFLDTYPPPAISFLSEFSLFIGEKVINKWAQQAVAQFMRHPFLFFPSENVYVNYPDAVHFQRGIQNMRVRDFQVQINIPNIQIDGKVDLDYDLIQKLWWGGLEIAEQNAEIINIALEMRIFKGSKATMAPQIGYDYVCSIQILRSLNLDEQQEEQWRQMVSRIFNVWKNTLDSNGSPVIIRPHWGKEWDMYPEVKEHTFNDQLLLGHVRNFVKDYEEIAKLKGFDKDKNLKAFSNQIYRELLGKATGTTID